MRRHEIGHNQRTVFSGTFSRSSGDARRDAGGSDGAGRKLVLFKLARTSSRIGYFMSADDVKFRKPVMPGDTMFIHAELTKSRGERLAKAKCHCVVNDAIVSEAELMFTFLDK